MDRRGATAQGVGRDHDRQRADGDRQGQQGLGPEAREAAEQGGDQAQDAGGDAQHRGLGRPVQAHLVIAHRQRKHPELHAQSPSRDEQGRRQGDQDRQVEQDRGQAAGLAGLLGVLPSHGLGLLAFPRARRDQRHGQGRFLGHEDRLGMERLLRHRRELVVHRLQRPEREVLLLPPGLEGGLGFGMLRLGRRHGGGRRDGRRGGGGRGGDDRRGQKLGLG